MLQSNMFSESVAASLSRSKIVAVLVIDDAAAGPPLAKALLEGGIDIMELTLRTPAALPALAEIKRRVPEMVAGIGTVLTPEQVAETKAAGAEFAVAPGFNPRVLAAARQHDLPFAPGVCTPSEIEGALETGCRVLKFFPAETSGGIRALRSMTAPYAHLNLKFMPLGGLNADNFVAYLKDPAVIAVGGSWLAKRDEIRRCDWAAITAKARQARQAIDAMADTAD